MNPHSLKECFAISFDIGGTLMEHLSMPIFEIHKKFILQVCGDNYSFTDEVITKAIDIADEEIWKFVSRQDIHYFFSEEDWIERNRLVLVHLDVKEDLDELAQEYQTLWKKNSC